MTVDIVKLYEEVKESGRSTGTSAEVERHIQSIIDELRPRGVSEIPLSMVRKMVEEMMKNVMDEVDREEFKLDYSVVRNVVKRRFNLVDRKLVFEISE